MEPMEVSNEVRIHDVTGRHPQLFLWTIALPIDQILMAPASASHGQQPFYSVNLLTIDESGGRRGFGGGNLVAVPDRFDAGNMEFGMNSKRLGKTETDGCRIYDLGDGKRGDEAGSKLTGLNTERKVPSRQPNSLARLVYWFLLPSTIR